MQMPAGYCLVMIIISKLKWHCPEVGSLGPHLSKAGPGANCLRTQLLAVWDMGIPWTLAVVFAVW